MTRFLSSLGLDGVAEKFESEGLDGTSALTLTTADLKDIGITQVGERKKTEAAIKAMKHPLMAAFQRCDIDGNFKIDADELTHVMARVNGAPLLEEEVRA